MESILETKATTILEFFAGLRGTLSVTFEEGTLAAWLYDLLKPHVANLVVCVVDRSLAGWFERRNRRHASPVFRPRPAQTPPGNLYLPM
jgi:hypothetical protein